MSARTGRQLAVTAEIGWEDGMQKMRSLLSSIRIAKQAGGEGGVPG